MAGWEKGAEGERHHCGGLPPRCACVVFGHVATMGRDHAALITITSVGRNGCHCIAYRSGGDSIASFLVR